MINTVKTTPQYHGENITMFFRYLLYPYIAFSIEKSSHLNQQRNMQFKHHLQAKTNMWVDFDVRGTQMMDFFTGGSVNMDYGSYFDGLK